MYNVVCEKSCTLINRATANGAGTTDKRDGDGAWDDYLFTFLSRSIYPEGTKQLPTVLSSRAHIRSPFLGRSREWDTRHKSRAIRNTTLANRAIRAVKNDSGRDISGMRPGGRTGRKSRSKWK